MAIRADDRGRDLGRESFERMRRERRVAKGLEALVAAAHPRRATAGEDHAGDARAIDHRRIQGLLTLKRECEARNAGAGQGATSAAYRCT